MAGVLLKKGQSMFTGPAFIFKRFYLDASLQPQQLPFPLCSSATHASSGSDTHHHVTHHAILNHRLTHTLTHITSYSYHPKYKTIFHHTRHLRKGQQHRVTVALHFFSYISFFCKMYDSDHICSLD